MYVVNKNCLGKLKVIHISFQRNEIRHIKKLAFQHQKDTISINLDGNQLGSLPFSSFAGMENLKYISVMHNNLSKMHKNIFLIKSLIWINYDNILLCCKYKEQNKWCNTTDTENFLCTSAHSPDFYPSGLIIGCIEFTISVIVCLLYLWGNVSKLSAASSYRIVLVSMHINQALYGMSLVFTDVYIRQGELENYIQLTGLPNSSFTYIAASIMSLTSILFAAFVQVIVSLIRYEAIKNPLFTEMKRSSVTRNIMILLSIACLLVSLPLFVVVYQATNEHSYHAYYHMSCSLVTPNAQNSNNIFTLAAWIVISVYFIALVFVNTLYTLICVKLHKRTLVNKPASSNRSLVIRISCLLITNDSFWLTSCFLLLPFQFLSRQNILIKIFLFFLIPITDLINVCILSKIIVKTKTISMTKALSPII